jgi:hypothetical protein
MLEVIKTNRNLPLIGRASPDLHFLNWLVQPLIHADGATVAGCTHHVPLTTVESVSMIAGVHVKCATERTVPRLLSPSAFLSNRGDDLSCPLTSVYCRYENV